MRKISLGQVIFTHQTFQRTTCFKVNNSEGFEMYSLELGNVEDVCQITIEMIKQLPGFNSKTV